MEKRAYQERPVRYEYRLTDKGIGLYPVIVSMLEWGNEWLDWDVDPPVHLVDRETGERLEPVLVDRRTGKELEPRKTTAVYQDGRGSDALSRNGTPRSRSSSPSASSGSTTLMVAMPIALAGLRLMPRSSRNTVSLGGDAHLRQHQLVGGRLGLAHALLRRLDDDVEQLAEVEGAGPARPSSALIETTLLVSSPVTRPWARQRRTASIISGRSSPLRRAITSRPSTRWPSASDSAANAASKPARSSSLRSKLRPRVGVGVGGVDRADEALGDARGAARSGRRPRTATTTARRRSPTARL